MGLCGGKAAFRRGREAEAAAFSFDFTGQTA
jgi:hypothetical protein